MPNSIVGLRYEPINNAESEEELLAVFADLKQNFEKFGSQFRITCPVVSSDEELDLKTFLEVASNNRHGGGVFLIGSGDVGGLEVKDACVRYDLSRVADLTRFWDQYRDGSILACIRHAYKSICQSESVHACSLDSKTTTDYIPGDKEKDCPCGDYTPKRPKKAGSKEPARKLEVLIAEASQ